MRAAAVARPPDPNRPPYGRRLVAIRARPSRHVAGLDAAAKIAAAAQVSVEWLATGQDAAGGSAPRLMALVDRLAKSLEGLGEDSAEVILHDALARATTAQQLAELTRAVAELKALQNERGGARKLSSIP